MANANNDSKTTLRKLTFKALKATIKGAIFYAFYFFLWVFLAPFSELIPSLQMMIETFVIVYIVLVVIGDLTSGTIFQYFFNAAKALFVICYLIFSLNGGIFGITFDNISLSIDLRLFLMIATLLGLLGFAKSILQAVDYMNTRAEYKTI